MAQSEKGYNSHYSEQTGHFAPGQVARVRQSIERQFPGVPFMPSQDMNVYQIRRRSMRRISKDGRK